MAQATATLQRQSGANLTQTKKDLAKWAKQVVDLKTRRTEINAEIGELRAKAESAGVPKKAFDDAIRYWQADADKRAGYDEGYQITREALGVQMDMFEPLDDALDRNPNNAPREMPPVDEVEQQEGAAVLSLVSKLDPIVEDAR